MKRISKSSKIIIHKSVHIKQYIKNNNKKDYNYINVHLIFYELNTHEQ